MLQPEHYDRIKRLGVMIHPQTWHFYNLRRNFLNNCGREYADMSHPYRTILQHGIHIAGGNRLVAGTSGSILLHVGGDYA